MFKDISKQLKDSFDRLGKETLFRLKYFFLTTSDNLEWKKVLIEISKDKCGFTDLEALQEFISLRKYYLKRENLPMTFAYSQQSGQKKQKDESKQKNLNSLTRLEKLLDEFLSKNHSFNLRRFSNFLQSKSSIFGMLEKEDKISLIVALSILGVIVASLIFSAVRYEILNASILWGIIPFPEVFNFFIVPAFFLALLLSGYLIIRTILNINKNKHI